MSTGVAGGGSGGDGSVTVVTTTGTSVEEQNVANTSAGSAGANVVGAGKTGQLTLTPRFTQEEKEILYSLFHEHEEVIDIKFRKKQRSKYSVRDAWENIVREFNSHPGVSAVRNLKQIQKFWLNARLRKQYPFRPNAQKDGNNAHTNIQRSDQQDVAVSHRIKDEPDFQLSNADPDEHGSQNDTFEEIEMDTGDGQLESEHIEPIHQHQQQQQQQQQQPQQHQVLHVQQQQHQQQIQTQQISVDQISAEKLTLNDLLQFKTTRPREDIILQIKHPTDSTTAHITIPSPTRITIPSQHQTQQHTITAMPAATYNQQIISEIKPQQITLAQYQAQQLQQQQLAQHQLAVAAQQQQQQQQQQQHHQVKMQLQSPATAQFATATPTFTCTTLHALPVASAPASTVVPTLTVSNTTAVPSTQGNATITMDSFEEKLQYFRLKEAELRFKEVQVTLEKKKIELNRAQEELKHLREVHRLQVEELKMKIRILQEEEKVLRKSPATVQM